MHYTAILGRAWRIVTQHKALWLFGILAALSMGGTNWQTNSDEVQQWTGQLGGAEVALMCLAAVVGLFVFAIVIALTTMGYAGLIKGTLEVEAGAPSLAVGQLWSDSRPYFWRLLGLSVLVIVLVIVAIIGVAVALGLLAITIVGLVIAVPAFCLLLLAGPAIWAYLSLAQVSVVADDLGPVDALGRAWQLMRPRLGEVWIMGVIVFVVMLAFGVALGLIAAVVTLPFVAMGAAFWPLMLLAMLVGLLVALVIGGLLQSYLTTVWTLVHGDLAGRAALPPPPPPPSDLLPAP